MAAQIIIMPVRLIYYYTFLEPLMANCSICYILLSISAVDRGIVLFSEALTLTTDSDTYQPWDFFLMSACVLSG